MTVSVLHENDEWLPRLSWLEAAGRRVVGGGWSAAGARRRVLELAMSNAVFGSQEGRSGAGVANGRR